MPIISKVGRRSLRMRIFIGGVFTLLTLGTVTMIYPLLLMLAGSVKSQADFDNNSPWPEYLNDDTVLWRKYVESKYGGVAAAEAAFGRSVRSWKNLEPPICRDRELVEEFRSFRGTGDWPFYFYKLGHGQFMTVVAKNARMFREQMRDRFDGDIDAFSRASGERFKMWSTVGPPLGLIPFASRTCTFPNTGMFQFYCDFKERVPRADWDVVNVDGYYHMSFPETLLATHPPPPGPAREDWESFVRTSLNMAFIRFDASALENFRKFLEARYAKRVAELNAAWGTKFAGFEQAPLASGFIANEIMRTDLTAFVKDRNACPLSALSIYGPRQAFEEFVARRRGVAVGKIAPLALPIEEADYADFLEQRGSFKWECVKRNYLAVIDYLFMHSNGIRNTAIFCALAVLTQLLVNPLAAYALSRYRPPATYTILLFCMATMAFPAEVTMIPAFLLLRRFPLGMIAAAIALAALAGWAMRHCKPHWPGPLRSAIAISTGIVAGFWLLPSIGQHLANRDGSVNLLNTFWALVLPGAANGFSIFLLKGFFDSLPRDLYESAELDGAGEWTKFWTITMSLSKPILAVLALGAFVTAYSEFMMALVIVPDQKMWTMMVWLFQLQQGSHPSVVYASLVVAALPMLAMFLFCQNLIMRGIVVPTEK